MFVLAFAFPSGEGMGVGQRRQRLDAADSASRPERRPPQQKGKPFAKPPAARHAQHDDDAGPLLDRPKRAFRSNDRRPGASPGNRPPAGKGGPAKPPRGTPAPGKRGPRK